MPKTQVVLKLYKLENMLRYVFISVSGRNNDSLEAKRKAGWAGWLCDSLLGWHLIKRAQQRQVETTNGNKNGSRGFYYVIYDNKGLIINSVCACMSVHARPFFLPKTHHNSSPETSTKCV